ncbi:MAG: DUF4231 domain-containing protein [Gammaproteobacteria bacterium]|nr:DUF4231 domain-containing protein [Gammaproteobacteria bacterium]
MTSAASGNSAKKVQEKPGTAKSPSEAYREITFANNNTAQLIHVSAKAKPNDCLGKLHLSPPKALIITVGGSKGFDEGLKPRLLQLFSRGIARAAASVDAILIDGGTQTGGMAMMGQGVADRGYKSPLIGIAPASRVTYPGAPAAQSGEDKAPLDPNHSHFILVDDVAEWGGQIGLMYRFVETLRSTDVPVVTVLVNGGKLAQSEVLRSVRLGSPVIVFAGSGRLADEIAELCQDPPELIEDPDLAEIVQEGDINLFPMESSVAGLERLISRQLRGDSTLKLVWRQFGAYDLNAVRHQRNFQRIQNTTIWLGVLGTLMALSYASVDNYVSDIRIEQKLAQERMENVFESIQEGSPLTQKIIQDALEKNFQKDKDPLGQLVLPVFSESTVDKALTRTEMNNKPLFQKGHQWLIEWLEERGCLNHFQDWLLKLLQGFMLIMHYVVLAVPILTAALVAAANEFKSGNKWILLRSGAELLKSEIFRYRAQAEIYNNRQTAEVSREVKLAESLRAINNQLIQTEVNLSALTPYKGQLPPKYGTAPGDNGFSVLSPENYLSSRLEDQLNFYVSKTAKLEKRLRRLQWLIYGVGGIGTLLAAIGLEPWIALTGSLTAAFGAYIKYHALEESLMKFNQAAISLTNVRNGWIALSAAEQAKQKNIDALIGNTEGILKSEFSSWVQEKQDAMAAFQDEQEKQTRQEEKAQEKSKAHVRAGAAKPRKPPLETKEIQQQKPKAKPATT